MRDVQIRKELAKHAEHALSFAYGVITASFLVNIALISRNMIPGSGQDYSTAGIYLFISLFTLINCIAFKFLLTRQNKKRSTLLRDAAVTLIPAATPGWILFSGSSTLSGIFHVAGIMGFEAIVLSILFLKSRRALNKPGQSDSEVVNDPSIMLERSINKPPEEELNPLDIEGEYDNSQDFTSEEEILHQMSRTKSGDGTESMSGTFRTEIPAGGKTQTVHLSFWPAFENIPQIECETIADIPVKVRPVEIRNYGVRLEVRRTENLSQSCPVEIEYFIQEQVKEQQVVQERNVA